MAESDYSSMSNEELMSIAGVGGESSSTDFGSMSNEQLFQIAGVQPPSSWRDYLAGSAGAVGSGLTFGLVDEAAAGLRSILPGFQDYDSELAAIRQGQAEFAQEHPAQNAAYSVAGGLVLPGGAALKTASALKTGMIGKAALLGLEGAGYGGAYGFGSAEGGVDNRVQNAGENALIGAVLNPVAAGVIGGAGKIGKSVWDTGKNLVSSSARDQAAKVAASDIVTDMLSKSGESKDEILNTLQAFNQAPPTKFSPYMRTAEVTESPTLSTLEMSLRKQGGIEPLVQRSDAEREGIRQMLFDRLSPEKLVPEEQGNAIREALSANLERSQAKIGDLAERAFKGAEELKSFPAKAAVSDALRKFTKDGSRSVSGSFQNLVDNFRALPPRVDLQTLQNYRSAFGKFAGGGGIGADPVDKMTAEIAGTLRKTIDTVVENAAEKGELPKGQFNAWRKMIDLRRDQWATFESGVVGKLLREEPYGAGYRVDSSEVAKKAIQTPEDARALMKAIGPHIPGKQATRSALLDQIYQKSTSAVTGDFNPNSFAKQLQVMKRVMPEILTPAQERVLGTINRDLVSQGTAGRLAYSASKGQSITAQAGTAIDELQKAMRGKASSLFGNNAPILYRVIEAVKNAVTNPAERERLLSQHLTNFVLSPDAAESLLRNVSSPQGASALEALGKHLLNTLPRALVAPAATADPASDGSGARSSARIGPRQKEQPQSLIGVSSVRSTAPIGPIGQVTGSSSGDSQPSPNSTKTVPETQELIETILPGIRKVESSDGKKLIGPQTKYGKAKGPYQLIDQFGKAMHEKLGLKEPYDPFNEDQAKRIAGAMLAENLKIFDGDIFKAVTAYHTGAGNVQKGKIGPIGRQYASKVFEAIG